MQLEQVKEHFKDAKEVRCVLSKETLLIDYFDLKDIHYFQRGYWIDLKTRNVELYDIDTNQLAEIVTYKDKDMKITEQQIKDLDNGSTTARELFPQVFETELEVGVWYKDNEGLLFNFQGKYSRLYKSGAYGFTLSNEWHENIGVSIDDGHCTYEKANLEEVKQRMTEELVKLGFVKGCSFTTPRGWNKGINTSGILDFEHFNEHTGWTIYIDGLAVFHNGKFATLIQEPTQKEILQAKIKEIQQEIDKL